jgi:formylglycine-generating enzyme required for sulfatase activity
MKALLNRADILRCLKEHDPSLLDNFAAILGYALVEKVEENAVFVNGGSLAGTLKAKISQLSPTSTPAKQHARFIRVVAHKRFDKDENSDDKPGWYAEVEPFQDNDAALTAPVGLAPPPQPPLMAWRRLWPFLKLALGTKVLSHKADVSRAVERLARGEQLRRLPKISRKGWAAQAQLIIDYDDSLRPFWSDFNSLRHSLAQLRGQVGLTILAFPTGDPSGPCWQDTPKGWRTIERYTPPLPGTPILILSDLGCNEAGDQRRLRWRRFGEKLAFSDCRALALMPIPKRWWDAELARLFIAVYWDRAARPPQRLGKSTLHFEHGKIERDCTDAKRLLGWLATAVRVEPALLREARYLFPGAKMDVGTEYAAWNHVDVQATHLGFYFQKNQGAQYRERFRVDASLTADGKQQLADLLHKHHAHLSPVITYEEQLAKAALTGESPPEEAEKFTRRLAKTLHEKVPGDIGSLSAQWLGRIGVRQQESEPLWNNDALGAAWYKAKKEGYLTNETTPAGLSLEKAAWIFDPKPVVNSRCYQRGHELFFADSSAFSPVGELSRSISLIEVETIAEDAQRLSQLYPFGQPLALTSNLNLCIRTDREEMQLDWLTLPPWADTIGRDNYGLYTDLSLDGITQRFRWINPGTFLMGSPDSEPERRKGETQHEVTLTEGYWLADTACTQALWQAVTGGNSSRFQDAPNNPVEKVSWDDVQAFIEQLNGMIPELRAKLPSEAQWEYACRAGTITPFSFGANITPEQVNYDGNYPYGGGIKGLYRKKTVPVKSLPVNPWGLYEMHGNVWEWCQDWYGDYKPEAAVDPVGAYNRFNCVLRGGSWIYGGRSTRSASRGRRGPADRDGDFGFRLALG